MVHVRRTLDFPMVAPAPQPGDVLLCPRRAYRIDAVEPVETRLRCDRWRLDVAVLGRRQHPDGPWPLEVRQAVDDAWRAGQAVHTSVPYRRGEPPSVVWGVDGDGCQRCDATPEPVTTTPEGVPMDTTEATS